LLSSKWCARTAKADEQQRQVGEHDPFITEVTNQALQTCSFSKARENELVCDGRRQAGERHRKGVIVEDGHTHQGQPE
jgi:hypothetical protein